MGFSVHGTMTYGKPLIESVSTLPAVSVAFFEASIDKAFLAWLDVSKLLIAFPDNVKAMGDTVILQGPVMIVSSMSPTRRLFMQCSLALAATFISYVANKFLLPATSRLKLSARSGLLEASSTHGRSVVAAIGALAMGALVYYIAGRYLPTQAGVYYYNQTPFHA
jgi:divalent metal cation (Fe/Co/Zn/Cd) transporter